MSTTKHTPRPWTVGTQQLKGGFHVFDKSRGDIVAKVYDTFRPGEMEANAALIAAAPDLLEACKRMVRASENHGSRKQCMQQAMIPLRAAIAKANGVAST